ncbi:hypothetical protein PENSPDRAFT_747493 [Peniophora sp. CONT]|nr:hypothetical protein PENSPDRAFT_747493 [Peniophora sp. CONT]
MSPKDKDQSPLAPVDARTVSASEEENDSPWLVRKVAGSLTGRVVTSTLESLRASGTNVVCLSPWGDNSPLLIPNIRFRDLVVSGVVAATGGTAAIAGPALEPLASLAGEGMMGGGSTLLELAGQAGFELATNLADDKVFEDPIAAVTRHEKVLETSAVKELLITLEHKQTTGDASLGFYRSSLHEDSSLFAESNSKWKDYLAVSKGWMNPYLFASARRPVIPRSMNPDVIFAHGPFLRGDYKIGQTLLNHSASVIVFEGTAFTAKSTDPAGKQHADTNAEQPDKNGKDSAGEGSSKFLGVNVPSKLPTAADVKDALKRTRTPPPPTPEQKEPEPRRMLVCVTGIKPHRKIWSTSARPEESVMYYQLLNGCPSIALPVQKGAPLFAWDTFTLSQLWNIKLPENRTDEEGLHEYEGVVSVLTEFLELCVDWKRMNQPKFTTKGEESVEEANPSLKKHKGKHIKEKEARVELRKAVELLVAGAIKSGESAEARKKVDKDRAGIAMWRIP